MPSRTTLHNLADRFILETRRPFTSSEFETWIKHRWQRKIADATLAKLKRRLAVHENLIEMRPDDYLPFRAAVDKIRHIPLHASPGLLELRQGIFIGGSRLVPFVSTHCPEKDLVLLDADGHELPKLQKQFFLDEVIQYYRYSGEAHFPDPVHLNEQAPAKSRVTLTVWDFRASRRTSACTANDGFKLHLMDYEQGRFRLELYPREKRRADSLRLRSFYIALGSALTRLSEAEGGFLNAPLEKQLLRLFFELAPEILADAPAFSLMDFLDSLDDVSIIGYEEGGPSFVLRSPENDDGLVWEVLPQHPEGQAGSLQAILEDMGFPFTAAEFTAILHTALSSESYSLEKVFQLLFGGKEDRFYSRGQKTAFFRHLRKMVARLIEERKMGEPRLVAELREKVVDIKLRLVSLLRRLESFNITLAELPQEILEQVVELDGFCGEVLPGFGDCTRPPDIKSIRYTRTILNIIQPALSQLEAEIHSQLDVE